MSGFWIAAAALAFAAAAFLLVPLWRLRKDEGSWSISGTLTALATVPVAVLIYLSINTWEEDPGPDIPPEQAAMVAQLAERLASNPDDVDGWLLLGRSYMVLGQYALGREAYEQAWARTPAPDDELKLALAEAMILSQRASIGAEAGQLIEEVLQGSPRSQKALWYGGLVALERGREDVACTRWSALLGTNPPADVAGVLQRQMAALPCDVEIPAVAAEGPSIELNVRLGQDLAATELPAQAALFIFARASGGGPPVAVLRQSVATLPGTFTLSDANSMLPGRSLADFPELALVARISNSGQPIEASGDLFAETTYRQGDATPIELIIDQVVP